jgi:hypothetical protein
MKVENLRKVANAIEAAPDEEFFMGSSFIHSCGTPACIAGFASSFAEGGRMARYYKGPACFTQRIVEDFLGLGPKSAQELFYPASHARDDGNDVWSLFYRMEKREKEYLKQVGGSYGTSYVDACKAGFYTKEDAVKLLRCIADGVLVVN